MNYLAIVLSLIAIICVAVFGIYTFIQLPTESQIESMQEWLKYAVTMAEMELGSGTGQLKLRMVYDLFVDKFTWLAKFISFENFSAYVDEALVWLNCQLASNKAVSELVTGEFVTFEDESEV